MKPPIEKNELKKWRKLFDDNDDLINLYKGLLVKPEFAEDHLKKICKQPQYKNLKSCKTLKEQLPSTMTTKITTIIFPQPIINKIISMLDKLYKVEEFLFHFKFDIENSTIKIKSMFTPQKLEREFENDEEYFGGHRFYRYYIINKTVVSGHNHPYYHIKILEKYQSDIIFLPSFSDIDFIGELLQAPEIDNHIEIIITQISKYKTPFAKYKKFENLPEYFEKFPETIPCYKHESEYFYFWITASLFTKNEYPNFKVLNIEVW